MDTGELTPQTAPRDTAALALVTPYHLRRLAETHLAGLRDEKEKMAWFSLKTSEARAGYILELLKRWDAQTNGVPHANGVMAPAVSAPVTEQVTGRDPVVRSVTPTTPNGIAGHAVTAPVVQTTTGAAPMIPQVDPAALAAATAAPQDSVRGRTPKTKGPATTAADAAGGEVIVNLTSLLTRLLEDQANLRKGLEAMELRMAQLFEEAGKRDIKTSAQLAAVSQQLEAVSTIAQNTAQFQVWTLMAFATAQPNASADDVIRCAITDSQDFNDIVKRARGKE